LVPHALVSKNVKIFIPTARKKKDSFPQEILAGTKTCVIIGTNLLFWVVLPFVTKGSCLVWGCITNRDKQRSCIYKILSSSLLPCQSHSSPESSSFSHGTFGRCYPIFSHQFVEISHLYCVAKVWFCILPSFVVIKFHFII
jgi:hypothetical protein